MSTTNENIGQSWITTRCIWLFAFAWTASSIAQPVYEHFTRDVSLFLCHHFTIYEILSLVVAVSAILPLLFATPALIAFRISRTVAWEILCAEAFLLATIFIMQIIAPKLDDGIIIITLAIITGFFIARLFSYSARFRNFSLAMAIGAIIFPVNFLRQPSIRSFLSIKTSIPLVVGNENVIKKFPIYLIVFDELPLVGLLDSNMRIDKNRFPTFARLADHSHWYRNATTVVGRTVEAVPSILTGRYPPDNIERQPFPRTLDYPRNIFTFIRWHYRLHVYEQLTRLCPESLCPNGSHGFKRADRLYDVSADLFNDSLATFLPRDTYARLQDPRGFFTRFILLASDTTLWNEDPWENYVAATPEIQDDINFFNRFMASIPKGSAPTFNFAHITFPHTPYTYYPSGRRYEPQNLRASWMGHLELRNAERWNAILDYQRFLLQLGYADTVLKRLVSRLQDQGTYDQSMIIVTADHGQGFTAGAPTRFPTWATQGEVLPIPLLVKMPGQHTAIIDDRNAETVDIVPTILDAINLPTPWPVDGSSLLAADPHRPTKRFFQRDLKGRHESNYEPHIDLGPALQHKVTIFGKKNERLENVGPQIELFVDRTLESVVGSNIIDPDLENESELLNVKLDQAYIPAILRGRFTTTTPLNVPKVIGIAVDGKIEATAVAYPLDSSHATFEVLLPEHSLHTGANRVEIGIFGDAPENYR